MPDPERLDVQFVLSAPTLSGCPAPDTAEVAFAGRSNAGKSSVLNRLTGSRQTARVSKTPGRTRTLNFFAVKEGGRLVDLPGYGYAKAGKAAQASWQRAVNEYLSRRESLTGVVLVMDIRHPLTAFDAEVISWADASAMPLLALLNKADKLKHGARQKTLRAVTGHLSRAPLCRVQLFSARSGIGIPEVLGLLRTWLEPTEPE